MLTLTQPQPYADPNPNQVLPREEEEERSRGRLPLLGRAAVRRSSPSSWEAGSAQDPRPSSTRAEARLRSCGPAR